MAEVSKDKLNEMRSAFESMFNQFIDRLENNVEDSAGAKRDIIYASDKSIAMLGQGGLGEHTKVIADGFNKSIVQIDGSIEMCVDGVVTELTDESPFFTVDGKTDFTSKSTSEHSAVLIVLRKDNEGG